MDSIFHAHDDHSVEPSSLRNLNSEKLRLRIASTEAKISRYHEELTQCRSILNARASLIIVKLPPEILQMVFTESMLMCKPTTPADTRTSLLWYRVAHVCRHWRSIVLSTRELFTCFFIEDTMHDSDKAFASASEWLDRAKGAPLEIIGTIRWGFDSRRVWQLLIPHLDRTFTLSIAFVMIQNIWTSAGHCRSWIPVQKLLDSLPNLRDLEISVQYGATDSWLPHVTNPHLTRLALTGGNKTVQDHETLFKGISVLQSLPLLEKLELENVYVIRRAREVNRPQSIFASLRHLTMSGGCSAIATFLKCTNCLQTVHLSINVVNPIYVGFKDSKDILMFGVISFCEILQLIHDTTLQSIVTARIGTECDPKEGSTFTFKGWSSHIPFQKHAQESSTLGITLIYPWKSPIPVESLSLMHFFREIILSLSTHLPALQTLNIAPESQPFFTQDLIFDEIAACCFENIRSLKVNHKFSYPLARCFERSLLLNLSILHITIDEEQHLEQTIRELVPGLKARQLENARHSLDLVLELTGTDPAKWNVDLGQLDGLVRELKVFNYKLL